MAFGACIKKLREDAGISVDKLTSKIGVSASRWRKWEEKDYDPRDEDRNAIEEFFGMDLQKIQELTSISQFLKVPNLSRSEHASPDKNQYFTADQLFHMYMKSVERQDMIMQTQIDLLESIRKDMAKEVLQKDIASNLTETLAGVLSLSKRQKGAIAEFRQDLDELKSLISRQTRGSGKKSRETDGEGKKQGKIP